MGINEEDVKYVRENFKKKYAEKIGSGIYDQRDVRRFHSDDVFVTTFIRGRSRLDEGVDLVHECLHFRKEYGVNDLTRESFEQWIWDKQALFYHGHTKTGHKILFLRVKEHKKDASQLLVVKKFFAYWLEISFRAQPLEKIVALFDMSDAGLSNLDMDFVRFTLTCFRLYYPSILEKLLIYEMPWIFNAAWKVIKTWLSQEAIARIKFATKSDIHIYIDQDQLFEHMGGTAKLDLVNCQPIDSLDKRRVTFSESTDDHSSKLAYMPNNNNNAASRVTSQRANRLNSNSSVAEGGTFTGRLLTISPADELTFVADDSGREAFDVITLTNTLMYPIAFKVKTTSPEKYRVRPSTGVVKPGEAFEVYVYLQPGYINTVDKDKFLVMAMEVTGDSYDTSVWKTAPKESIMEHRMRCVSSGHTDFNVNVAMDGANTGGELPPGGAGSSNTAMRATPHLISKIETRMEKLIESNNQLRRRMGWLIVSHIVFFILTMLFFGAFFCLGEDLFSSYLYFPFGYCVSSSWSRRC